MSFANKCIVILILTSFFFRCSTKPIVKQLRGFFSLYGRSGNEVVLNKKDLNIKFFIKPYIQVDDIMFQFDDQKTNDFYWICAVNEDFEIVHCQNSHNFFSENQSEFVDDGIFRVSFHFVKQLELEEIDTVKLELSTNKGTESIVIPVK